jgi:transcriptional regulator with XRE-family HTH domain
MKTKTKRPQPTIGERIRAARLAAGLSQLDLAAKCGIGQPTLSSLENDRYRTATLGTLRRLAEAIGCELADLVI